MNLSISSSSDYLRLRSRSSGSSILGSLSIEYKEGIGDSGITYRDSSRSGFSSQLGGASTLARCGRNPFFIICFRNEGRDSTCRSSPRVSSGCSTLPILSPYWLRRKRQIIMYSVLRWSTIWPSLCLRPWFSLQIWSFCWATLRHHSSSSFCLTSTLCSQVRGTSESSGGGSLRLMSLSCSGLPRMKQGCSKTLSLSLRLWKSYMLSCLTKDEKLLCLKQTGSTRLENPVTLGTAKACPSSAQVMYSLCSSFQSIWQVLSRKVAGYCLPCCPLFGIINSYHDRLPSNTIFILFIFVMLVLLLAAGLSLEFRQARDIIVTNPCANPFFGTDLPIMLQAFQDLIPDNFTTGLAFQKAASGVLQVWDACELYLRMPAFQAKGKDDFEKGMYRLMQSECSPRAKALALLYEAGHPPGAYTRGQNKVAVQVVLGRLGMPGCQQETAFMN